MNSAEGDRVDEGDDEGDRDDEGDGDEGNDEIDLRAVPIPDVVALTDLVASILPPRPDNAQQRMREQLAIMYLDLIPAAEGDDVTVALYRRFLARARLDDRVRAQLPFQIDDQGLHSQRYIGNLDPRLVIGRVVLRNGIVVQKVSIEIR